MCGKIKNFSAHPFIKLKRQNKQKMSTVEPIRDLKDLKRVEKILEKKSKRDLLFFTIGTNCGLRISDILSLNVGDVRGKNYIQIVEKKTGKFKKFPINSKLKGSFAPCISYSERLPFGKRV